MASGIDEPPFDLPQTEGKKCICQENGQFRAYFDREGAISFLFDLYWLVTDLPIGEDINIWPDDSNTLPSTGRQIGICEVTLISEHTDKKKSKGFRKQSVPKPEKNFLFRSEDGRLDYFVTAKEVREAYLTLTRLITNFRAANSRSEATIFGNLVVRLVP